LLAGCTSMSSMFGGRAPDVYLVFFPASSTNLSADAAVIVKKAADTIRMRRPDTVVIAAGEDSADNMKLAPARFAAVRAALVADGVDDDLIARAPLAEIALNAGPTGDARVEIRLVRKTAP